MKILNQEFTISQIVCLILYYGIAIYLPKSQTILFGKLSRHIRVYLCRHIFKKCGRQVNIERGAVFGRGTDVEIGDYSGIGVNAHIPCDAKIGNFVMMAPNCYIHNVNHNFSDISTPMCMQGFSEKKGVVIEDDCWIGRDVIMTPGRTIKRGSVIGTGCVLCKDFPEYSIVGGNPSKLIRLRNNN